ncbi:hypothetical protein ACQBAU_00995 [Propionibacteriaceae bacterium Y2011]|uniref:hypothetical protein n=1 Tax=Microlunatus sp. Y2014 TaxID=3418488 RepID=UPI003B43F719
MDEVQLHLIPVLLGAGRSLFAEIGAAQRELERIQVQSAEDGVTHLRFRVRH